MGRERGTGQTSGASDSAARADRAEVYAPIVSHVHAVVSGESTPASMLTSLISRDSKHEKD